MSKAKVIVCTNCGSKNVSFLQQGKKGFSVGKAVGGAVLVGGVGALAGFTGKKDKKEFFCNDCNAVFKSNGVKASTLNEAGEQKTFKEINEESKKLLEEKLAKMTPKQAKSEIIAYRVLQGLGWTVGGLSLILTIALPPVGIIGIILGAFIIIAGKKGVKSRKEVIEREEKKGEVI